MKTIKIISLILVLCMAMYVFAIGIVTASGAERNESNNLLSDLKEEIAVVGDAKNDIENELTESTDATDANAFTEAASEAATETATEIVIEDSKWYGTLNGSFNVTDEQTAVFIEAVGELKSGNKTILPLDVVAQKSGAVTTYVFLTFINDSSESLSYKKQLDRNKEIWGDKIYTDHDILQKYHDALVEYLESVKNGFTWWVYTVDVDSEGRASLSKREQIDLNNIKTTDKPINDWTVTAKEPRAGDLTDISYEIKNEILNYSDIKLNIISEIAYKSIGGGTDYLFMCYGTKDNKVNLYIVEVHDRGSKAEISNVSMFDLSAYVPAADNESVGNNTESAENSNNNATGTVTKTSTSTTVGTSTSTTSPKTGDNGMILAAILIILAVAGVCVSVKEITKKNS